MRSYKNLVESLPSRTVVFAFGRFNPPTIGHQLLVKFVLKLAQHHRADHAIFASKSQDAKNPLTINRKLHYLRLMFPNVNFVGADNNARTFIEAAAKLNARYNHLIMVAGSDRVSEFAHLLDKYNHKDFDYDSIKVLSAGERDPDADGAAGMSASKLRDLARQGNFRRFKSGLPPKVRDIDARRLMNDVREGMGLEALKESLKLTTDSCRELYFQGKIFNVGDTVMTTANEQLTIIKRGTNNLVCEDANGVTYNKWLNEVVAPC